jgi:hypothetical protein
MGPGEHLPLDDDGWTPPMVAALYDRRSIAEWLLAREPSLVSLEPRPPARADLEPGSTVA